MTSPGPSPSRNLSLVDSICIIVGTIIGAGIFRAAASVADMAGGPMIMVALWVIGGLMVMVGASCFIELTTRFPDEPGGDYAYLKKAWGQPVAFMFAWAAFWIVRPANIGVMAVVFAEHLVRILPESFGQLQIWPPPYIVVAFLAVLALSGANLIGIRQGTLAQNVLTFAKVAGIGSIIALALLNPAETATVVAAPATAEEKPFSIWGLWTPLVIVMFCYGGWNDLAMVASEIESPKRNLWRSIVFGVGIVIAVYVAFNVALWVGLGYQETAGSSSAAIDLVEKALGGDTPLAKRSADLIAALVCVSCLGAINGMIITSPRIYYAVGKDYPALSFLSQWNHERSCPWQAIATQAVVTCGLLLLCSQYSNVFEVLTNGSAPYFWTFLGLTVLSLFRFRQMDNAAGTSTDAVLVPLFPFQPIFFAIVCVGLSVSSTIFLIEKGLTYPALGIGLMMLVGVGLGMVLKSNK